jgi:hypothetical protein
MSTLLRLAAHLRSRPPLFTNSLYLSAADFESLHGYARAHNVRYVALPRPDGNVLFLSDTNIPWRQDSQGIHDAEFPPIMLEAYHLAHPDDAGAVISGLLAAVI